jgi:hypothetical protein
MRIVFLQFIFSPWTGHSVAQIFHATSFGGWPLCGADFSRYKLWRRQTPGVASCGWYPNSPLILPSDSVSVTQLINSPNMKSTEIWPLAALSRTK